MATIFKPGCMICSIEGVEFVADETGAFEVPAEAVALMVDSHGFSTTPPPAVEVEVVAGPEAAVETEAAPAPKRRGR